MDRYHILIAEDEALVAMDLCFTLEDAGYAVIGPASTLAETLTLIDDAGAIDAALLDVNLQGEAIFPAARVLADRGVPILIHTGHADRSEIAAHLSEFQLCVKPCDPRQLIESIARSLPPAAGDTQAAAAPPPSPAD